MDAAYFRDRTTLSPTGCWEWTLRCDHQGYGRMSYFLKRGYLAHRAAYEVMVGPIPEGLQLDHLCRNTRCVNPDHLEPVTGAVNASRSSKATRTTCAQGHPYDEANTHIRPTGFRECRACGRERTRRYQAKKRAA